MANDSKNSAADVLERVQARAEKTMAERGLAGPGNAALLMVSGGSDSTALAYLAADLHDAGALGAVAARHQAGEGLPRAHPVR